MQTWTSLSLLASLTLMVAGCPTEPDEEVGPSPLVLNEFMAANASSYPDASGAFPDWIELFNTSSTDVPMGSYAISDAAGQPLKHLLSDDLVIPAGGYLMLFADGDVDQGPNHLSFRLRVNGEDLVLSRLVNSSAEIVDIHQYGEQLTDISEGRLPNGTGAFTELGTASPEAANQ